MIEPLSINNQYAAGSGSYFPNPNHKYQKLKITRRKARRDQRETRKIEAFTGREGAIRRGLNSKNKQKRQIYRRAVANVLDHFYDQSILASEKSQFPALPKEAAVDVPVPVKGLSSTVRPSNKRPLSSELNETLWNAFVPTNYQKIIDLQITTPAIVIAGREQPYGGSEGSPEQMQVPKFIPNMAYGGTRVPYF